MRLAKQAMKRTAGVIAAVIASTAIPAVAEAQDQPWLRDRKYTEGIGYRVGDFELHPGVAAEFGYDSNYLHRDTTPVGNLRLRITPSLSLSTLSKERREQAPGPPPSAEFRAGISLTYNEFFPVSGPDALQGQMHALRDVNGALDLSLSILPSRPWSGQLTAGVSRNITPPELASGGGWQRDTPRASAELIWTPGGGLLDWRLGYEFTGTFFEQRPTLTNLQNEIRTRGRWRFLPRTALMYDARFGFISYTNSGGKTDSHPMRAMLGLNGLITSSFSLLAQVGWGASFYTPKPQEDFNSVIGQLEVKWFITPNPSNDPAAAGLALSTIALGFLRDFHDNYFGTYYERDRGYVNFSYFFGGRFLVVVDGGVAAIVHPLTTVPFTAPPFTDVRIDASLFGEYRFKNPFGINATLRYNGNLSSQELIVPGGRDNLGFHDIEAYLGARWMM
jgi:hypothetical protein